MTIRKLLAGLCVLTALCNTLLLLPSPFAQLANSASYYESQSKTITDTELQQMGVGRGEFERGIAFSVSRKSNEIWLRWGASAIFALVHLGCAYLAIRHGSVSGRVGLAVGALLFLIGWLASIPASTVNGEATLLNGYIFRILNEWSVASGVWFVRFAALFCVAPVAYIALLISLLNEDP